MCDLVPVRRALISVSDKEGMVGLARALVAHGAEVLSTGGSARALREAGVPVVDVAEHTGFPEILDGRVKTLLPQVHGGLLGRRDLPEHLAQMAEHGIAPIDLVCVNLYPFETTVASGAGAAEACVENIDIGGPAMIRSAREEFHRFCERADGAFGQYGELIESLDAGGDFARVADGGWAGAAYARTAAYDAAIGGLVCEGGEAFPASDDG